MTAPDCRVGLLIPKINIFEQASCTHAFALTSVHTLHTQFRFFLKSLSHPWNGGSHPYRALVFLSKVL